MRVAFLSPEAIPYSKTGGLGDVAGALPKALRRTGAVDVALFTPLYESTDRRLLDALVFESLEIPWRATIHQARVWYSEAGGVPTFLLDAPTYFARPGIYGYSDDHERFAFFCRATLALLRLLGQAPDIVHGNDWTCGFAMVELAKLRARDPFFARTRTLFSIHNLAYQGAFGVENLSALDFSDAESIGLFRQNGAASALKAGIMSADWLSTVSRRYALEIQTPELGYGLDWLLRARRERLVGITNGIDYEVWNPATDPMIAARYSADDPSGKVECKADLLRRFGLPVDLSRPVVATISRLVAQKGYDLIREAAWAMLEAGACFIALGAGAREYEEFLQSLRDSAPDRVGVYIGYAGEALAHQIEAGADIFLMPSLYEPCGLNQMYSMRYGTVPVVRATGGLDDTVEQFDRVRRTGTGFKFGPYRAEAMLESLYEAFYCYGEPEVWRTVQLNGMRQNNSWEATAWRYSELYHTAQRS
ncbi:glycogen/starch synthase [Pyrinomonas sp.]|uniref:glycogen synthase n=1 Tax=Pyrinomonas sp. TaxID=2080306 RepID=UPI0033289C4B